MSPYLTHLHSDIESAIVARWRACPPHFWVMGISDPFLILPKGLEDMARPDPDSMAPPLPAWMLGEEEHEVEASLEEVERFVNERPRVTMFDHFDLLPEAFPPAERLTDAQLEALVLAIRRLWAAFNFMPTLPEHAPARVVYPLLVQRMGKPAMLMKFGICGIEFCHYEPEECPFGAAWCRCADTLQP